jgi:hypothetical protein
MHIWSFLESSNVKESQTKKEPTKFVINELAGVSATADPSSLPLGPVPEACPWIMCIAKEKEQKLAELYP